MSCTTILAGKKITETGLVLAAHNEDERGRYVLYRGMLPERDWDLNDPAQAALPAEEGLAKVPQVKHTQRSYWVEHVNQNGGEPNADMFFNCHGVLFTSNAAQKSKPDPEDPALVKDGGIAYNIRRAVGERAKSARHGVQIALSLIAEWGHAAPGRNFTIADKDEAWNIQAVRGFYYAAARVPDDAVMVLSNHLIIHSLTEFPVSLALDPKDPKVPMDMDFSRGAILYPADLITNAIENGWYTPSIPGSYDDFDYGWVYQAESSWKQTYNTNRHLHGMRIIMDDPDLQCPPDPFAKVHQDPDPNFYPFCVRPHKPVTIEKMAEVLCSHVQLTPDAIASLGPGKTPHLRRGKILCYGNSTETTLIQFAEQAERTTLWTAFGRSCHQPFVPLHPLCGIPEILEPTPDPAKAIQEHFITRKERVCWQDNAWWQVFRTFQELADLQFCDVEEPLHALRHEHLEREKAANAEVLASGGDLAAFDRERIEAAMIEWQTFAGEHFNLISILPYDPISREEKIGSLTLRFRMPEGQTPTENGMLLAEGMVLLEEESSPVIPGSLRQNADGSWEAAFDAEQVLSHAYCKGDFDFYLGGLNTEGRTFAGQVILTFC